ncbi:MAG TPA: AAA family ATPase [Candidatus Saccharimonadales bacterium]|nr:AAA family ATPase [Candidatus Saccharimonadales bacterium]
MTVDEAFEHIKKNRPQIIFINGKTATGKTTFAKKLKAELGYFLIEMDTVARQEVIIPLGLPDNGTTFKEIYRYRNHLDWIDLNIRKLQEFAKKAFSEGHPVVFDGAMPNTTTMNQLFAGLPNPEILFFHPSNLKKYEQYVTQRFILSDENNNAQLPTSFWEMMDDDEFKKFCQTREITPTLKKIIEDYCIYGLKSSTNRLAELEQNFNTIVLVEI